MAEKKSKKYHIRKAFYIYQKLLKPKLINSHYNDLLKNHFGIKKI